MTTTQRFLKITFADGTTCSSGPNCKKHGGKGVKDINPSDDTASKTLKPKKVNVAVSHPHLIEFWHPTLNGDKTLRDFTSGSNFLATWTCPIANDHVYVVTIDKKANRGDGCPFCSGHKVCLSNSIATADEKISKEYDKDKNEKQANQVYRNSKTKVWWKCIKGHSWNAAPVQRTIGQNCPYCSGQKVAPENSIAGKFPHLIGLLDENKTGNTAWKIGAGSPLRAWWKCPTGKIDHEHSAVIRQKVKTLAETNYGCPYCSNYKVNGTNNMAFTNPKLAKEFDSTKNGILPEEIVAGSGTMMWWKCKKGHSWQSTPATRTYAKTQCPQCCEWNSSAAEDRFRKVALSNDLFAYVSQDKNHRLPIHWGKISSMAVDIIGIIKKTNKECVIEYDGAYFHNSDDVIERDIRKTKALLNKGYIVIRIRENQLPFINIQHDNLFQLNHKFSTKIEKSEETFSKINEWLKFI
jgi:hypothetical protein